MAAKREVVTEVNLLALVDVFERLGVQDVKGEIAKLKPRSKEANKRIATRSRNLYVAERKKSADAKELSSGERALYFSSEFKDLSDEDKDMWREMAEATVDENGYALKEKEAGAKEEKEAGATPQKKEEEMTEREMVLRGLQDAGVKDVAKKMAILFDNT